MDPMTMAAIAQVAMQALGMMQGDPPEGGEMPGQPVPPPPNSAGMAMAAQQPSGALPLNLPQNGIAGPSATPGGLGAQMDASGAMPSLGLQPPEPPGDDGFMWQGPEQQQPDPANLQNTLALASAAASMGEQFAPQPIQPGPMPGQPFQMPNTIMGLKEFLLGQMNQSPYQPY